MRLFLPANWFQQYQPDGFRVASGHYLAKVPSRHLQNSAGYQIAPCKIFARSKCADSNLLVGSFPFLLTLLIEPHQQLLMGCLAHTLLS